MKGILSKILLFTILAISTNCLKAKKSPFDFNNPTGLFIWNFFLNNTKYKIGGTITGHASGSLILRNNAEEKTIPSGTTKYEFEISQNSSYEIIIKSNPSGISCSIENNKGIANRNIDNANINCSEFKFTMLFPTNGRNWNDYIQRDYSKTLLSQTDTACNPNAVTNRNYFSCIHGAEIIKFDVPSRSSCENLTASDDATTTGGAFNWKCEVVSDKVVIYSTGFRNGDLGDLKANPPSGLSSLIDWTVNPIGFKKIKITIKDNTTTLLESIPTVFWNNSFRTNANCNLSVNAGETNTIFVFTNGSSTFDLNSAALCAMLSDKISFVVNPSVKLFSTGSGALIYNSANNFQWIEGSFNGNGRNGGIFLDSMKFTVIRNSSIYNTTGGAGIGVNLGINNSSKFNYIKNIQVGNMTSLTPGYGIRIFGNASQNILDTVSTYNNASVGMYLELSDNNLILNSISASNASHGISLTNSSIINTYFLNSTTALNSQHGISVSASSNGQFFMNTLITNNHTVGVNNNGLRMTVGGITTTLLNISSNNNADNSNTQIWSSGGGGGNRRFMGIVRNSFSTCSGSGGTVDGIDASCIATGLSDFSSSSNIDFNTSNPFINGTPLSSSDSVNSNFSSSGTIVYNLNNNWSNFQNFYRTIGVAAAATFPSESFNSRCSAGNCQLFNWSFRKSDSSGIRNIVPCPNNLTRPTIDVNGNIILRNAYEILGDWIGNDDGLCNSNEDCIYTPNIGAYQGHGDLVAASTSNNDYTSTTNQCANITTATGTDGTVTNIKLYKFEKNGY